VDEAPKSADGDAAPPAGEAPLLVQLVPRRGHPILAWLVIVLLAVSAVLLQRGRAEEGERSGNATLLLLQLQARYLVGCHELFPLLSGFGDTTKTQDDLARQAEAMNTGSPEQRLAAIIVIAELQTPEAALERLRDFDEKRQELDVELTPDEARLRAVIGGIYEDWAAEKAEPRPVDAADRALLEERLGWFGRLALTQIPSTDAKARAAVRTPALRTTVAIISIFFLGFGVGAVGLIGLLALLTHLASGRLAPGLAVPSGRGGVYAETFAVWMLVYLALGIGVTFLPIAGGRMLLSGLAMLLSLPLALAWPVLRGIPWRTVRENVGLTAGRAPWLEPPLGLATYAMALPLMAVGLMLTLLLMRLQASGGGGDGFRPVSMPSHPIVEYAVSPDWGMRLQVIFLASLVAPLVEETMFRGVLYYHLRDAGWRLSRTLSFLLAGGAVSLLFAAIHPQGLTTIPALMALAYAFTLVREWRGTLVPAMIAHGINNGVVVTLLIVALSD
jgi:membrane protease YdiL (CAAX protease family)